MNAAEAELVTRRVLGIQLPAGFEPLACPGCAGWWHVCRSRAGADLAHDRLARRGARALARSGALPGTLAPVLGVQPMTEGEGVQVDALARGGQDLRHPSACATPGCWHAQVRHRHGRYRPCEFCSCQNFTRQDRPDVLVLPA